jgi:hypothetical protein
VQAVGRCERGSIACLACSNVAATFHGDACTFDGRVEEWQAAQSAIAGTWGAWPRVWQGAHAL